MNARSTEGAVDWGLTEEVVTSMVATKEATLRLPVDLHRQLTAESERTGQPLDVLVCEAIELYLIEDLKARIPSIGSFSDPNFQAAEIDDWLAANWHPS